MGQAKKDSLTGVPSTDRLLDMIEKDAGARGAGLHEGMVEGAFADRCANQRELSGRAGLVGNIKALQGKETQAEAAGWMGLKIKATMIDQGMDPAEVDKFFTPAKLQELTDAIFATDAATWSNPEARQEHINEKWKEIMANTSFGKKLQAVVEGRGANYDIFSKLMGGQIEEGFAKGSEFNPRMMGANIQELFRKAKGGDLDAMATFEGLSEVHAQLSREMTGERGGMLRRGFSALMDPDTSQAGGSVQGHA
jgi:hypothetical protein